VGNATGSSDRIVFGNEPPQFAPQALDGRDVDGTDTEPFFQGGFAQRIAFGKLTGKNQDLGARSAIKFRGGIY
jgi:hypothetical protein